jgi:arabinofuranosyltransferase
MDQSTSRNSLLRSIRGRALTALAAPAGGRWSPFATAVLMAIPLLVLLAHTAHYMPFVADDALISHRYAQRLLAGEGLTWTDGPRVEGYSNLLWILLHAALGLVGIDLIVASRILGFGCAALVVWSLVQLHPRGPREDAQTATDASSVSSALAIVTAGAALALCGPFAVWTIGGLEQPLIAALLAWAVVRVRPLLDGQALGFKPSIHAGLPLGLLCLSRPDSPLLAGVFGLAVLLVGGVTKRSAWISALGLGVWSVACTLGQLGFRLVYYRDWVPNTAYLKAHWTEERFGEGVDYVLDGLTPAIPLVLLASLGLVAAGFGHHRARVGLLALLPLAWLSYVASVGGDIFPAHRHLIVALVCLALLAGEGLDWAARGLLARKASAWGLALAGLLYGLLQLQLDEPANARAVHERWEWDGEVMGPVFRESFGDRDPLMAVTAAGSLPYFSGLRALDMQGLNDRHIARQPADKGIIGHDHGDGAYVLDQQPDFMVFGQVIGGKPRFVSGRQLRTDPRFKRNYWLVHFEGFDPRLAETNAWVRLDGKLGLAFRDDVLELPPYLLKGSAGQQVGGPHMGARLPFATPVTSPPLELEPGRWTIEVEPAGLPLTVSVAPAGRVGLLASPGAHPAVEVRKRAAIRLTLTATRADTPISHLRLVRHEPTGVGEKLGKGASLTLIEVDPGRPIETIALGRFERGWDGWTVEGRSFAAGPSEGSAGKQKPVRGHVGRMLNSYHPEDGDETTGRATSPSFVAGADQVLHFRLGGGRDRGLHVLLVAEDGSEGGRTVVMAWTGNQKERLDPIRYDLGMLVGRTLHLEVIDDASEAWGHIMLDEVEILQY